MRIIGRPRALFSVLAASALLLTGCGSGPSQVDSAAIVGDSSVPLGEVQHEIQWLLDNVPAAQQAKQQRKFGNESRKIVQGRIVHELLEVAAQREGLRVDASEATELIESSGGLDAAAKAVQIEPSRVHQVATDQLMLQQLGQKYLQRLSVDLIGTTITEEAPGSTAEDKARALGRKLAADPRGAEQLLRAEGRQVLDRRFVLAEAVQSSPELATSAVFGAREGTVLVIQPSRQQGGWLVALIRDRDTSGSASGGAAAQAQQPSNPQLLYSVGVRLLQPIADELGIKVNPRYGVWDSAAMTIVSRAEELTGYQFEARINVQP
ncbi:hypothetical protein [Amycolatopsis aidingensis]|uniref:hypothetical protein n=1 Tax=Amycolatopsis aidingensis TaxID=2842453 RepID=UPI002FC7019A